LSMAVEAILHRVGADEEAGRMIMTELSVTTMMKTIVVVMVRRLSCLDSSSLICCRGTPDPSFAASVTGIIGFITGRPSRLVFARKCEKLCKIDHDLSVVVGSDTWTVPSYFCLLDI
jgi:hypothetical protein